MDAQPAVTPKETARRAEQDQVIANLITQARQKIELARDDPEIAPLLAARGYDAPKLKEGLDLQAAALTAFTARQSALAAQKQTSATANGAELTARHIYTDFRDTARAVFTASSARSDLGLTGAVPKDTQKFITTASASYTTAQQPAYAGALATYGFAANALTAALAALDAYTAAEQTHNTAIGLASQATARRDAAIKALNAWMKQFNKIVAVAFRNRPDLRRKLTF